MFVVTKYNFKKLTQITQSIKNAVEKLIVDSQTVSKVQVKSPTKGIIMKIFSRRISLFRFLFRDYVNLLLVEGAPLALQQQLYCNVIAIAYSQSLTEHLSGIERCRQNISQKR